MAGIEQGSSCSGKLAADSEEDEGDLFPDRAIGVPAPEIGANGEGLTAPESFAGPRDGALVLRHFSRAGAITLALSLPIFLLKSELAWPLVLALCALSILLNFHVVEGALAELSCLQPLAPLPGRQFLRGVPDSERALVVYPVLLRHPSELRFLEENFLPSILGNQDRNVLWAVVSGSKSSMAELEMQRLRELSARVGPGKIFYFHRHRAIHNWERKRGAYLHLMHWLRHGSRRGGIPEDPRFPAMPGGRVFDQILGEISSLDRIENLLVGDSDTIWPSGSVRGLLEKIAEPGNRCYTIFQGRIAQHNGESSTLACVQSLLHDLTRRSASARWRTYGRVNFIGHGAGWNIDRYLAGIAGRVADGYLSHDIVESFFLETAFVAEVETTEEAQETVEKLVKQWRRWWKGNRIASLRLLGPFRPDEQGLPVRNKNALGKLLILEADRPFLMPLLLGSYVALSVGASLAAGSSLAFPAVGVLYFVLGILRFFVPILVKIRDGLSPRKAAFLLFFSTMLAQILVIEVIQIVLKDAVEAIRERLSAHPRAFQWMSQGSLETRRGWYDVMRGSWYYPVAAGLALLAYSASAQNYSLLFLVLIVGLGLAPPFIWFAGLPPPSWLRRASNGYWPEPIRESFVYRLD